MTGKRPVGRVLNVEVGEHGGQVELSGLAAPGRLEVDRRQLEPDGGLPDFSEVTLEDVAIANAFARLRSPRLALVPEDLDERPSAIHALERVAWPLTLRDAGNLPGVPLCCFRDQNLVGLRMLLYPVSDRDVEVIQVRASSLEHAGRRPGVHANPNVHPGRQILRGDRDWDRVPCERPLDRHAALNGVMRVVEHDEEGITGGADHLSLPFHELGDAFIVRVPDLFPEGFVALLLAGLPDQSTPDVCGLDQVGEQEGPDDARPLLLRGGSPSRSFA